MAALAGKFPEVIVPAFHGTVSIVAFNTGEIVT
jgi:hypothetical protein